MAGIVDACTDTFEEPKPDWKPRKERYLARLADEPADALLVVGADMLYNARATLRDLRRLGDEVFERFNATGEQTLWYYGALLEAFRGSALESWLVDELERTVAALREAAR